MKTEKSRTAEQIFADMHRQLRSFNPRVPESLERLDPILRLLLEMYAGQLSRIDGRIDSTWEVAAHALIRSLSPEGNRWPVPAYTVMTCAPSDPVVEVDPDTLFIHKERREGSPTLFFSPMRTERILSAQVRHIIASGEQGVVDLSPVGEGGEPPLRASDWQMTLGSASTLYIGIEYAGAVSAFAEAQIFVQAHADVQKQLRWAWWAPSTGDGSFDEPGRFCPGLTGGLDALLKSSRRVDDWGGLRRGIDVFQSLQDSFVTLTDRFGSHLQPGPAPSALSGRIASGLVGDELYWFRLDLPRGGDRQRLAEPLTVSFSSFVVLNKRELTAFRHTGANRLVELELPEEISSILEITSVTDSAKREYTSRHQLREGRGVRTYSLEERKKQLVLWFDFSADLEAPPDSLTVRYTVTSGTAANGISSGSITELYDPHPGIDECRNALPTTGAIPAKSEEQIVRESTIRLRQRDRALTFREVGRWAESFDPRITQVECSNGVMRAARGVRRCIRVAATVTGNDFYSDDETELLKRRLESFLKSRAPVNTQFEIAILAR